MKYMKLVQNAHKPKGFWGLLMIKSMNKGHYAVTGWGLEKVAFKKNDVILDIGCGGGKTVHRLCGLVPKGKVYGMDYSDLAVEQSTAMNKRYIKSGRVDIRKGSVSNMPYKDRTFDVVTGIETFYFWPEPIEDLKEVRRVLKPGGTLLLVFEAMKDRENPDKWKKYEELIGLKVPSQRGMERYLAMAGFKAVQSYTNKNGWLCVTGQA